jgi:hypothetical protein
MHLGALPDGQANAPEISQTLLLDCVDLQRVYKQSPGVVKTIWGDRPTQARSRGLPIKKCCL